MQIRESNLGDSLAFSENNRNPNLGFLNRNAHDSGYFHLWVMKEYGVAESWAKLFTISPQEFVARTPPGFTRPTMNLFGFRKGGEVVLKWKSSDDVFFGWMDPNTKECNGFRTGCSSSIIYHSMDSRINGSSRCNYQFMDSFVERLVLLDHPDAISF